jgi:hypothetical protein
MRIALLGITSVSAEVCNGWNFETPLNATSSVGAPFLISNAEQMFSQLAACRAQTPGDMSACLMSMLNGLPSEECKTCATDFFTNYDTGIDLCLDECESGACSEPCDRLLFSLTADTCAMFDPFEPEEVETTTNDSVEVTTEVLDDVSEEGVEETTESGVAGIVGMAGLVMMSAIVLSN